MSKTNQQKIKTDQTNNMTETIDKIYFEGEMTESAISDLLGNIDHWSGHASKNEINLKMIVMELCSNIISHHSATPFCKVTIAADKDYLNLQVGNYVNENDVSIIEQTLNNLHKIQNLKEYYFELLNNMKENKSAKLGLIKIYRICERHLSINTELVNSKIFLTFNARIYDKH
jgi:hypothetical protein